ncbi:MAG TPA: pitrilysin family protein [Candidatus Polarisedimenticolaceae bacterium]|nr:pitrilysin family protein [Candidatus Polarisedimenticolaceae bacterium]
MRPIRGTAATLVLLAGLTALPAAPVKRYAEIKSPPLPAFTIPQPVTFTLKNGLRVFLIEDHEIPVVSVRALVRTGAFWEPQGKVGLARLTGTVQRTGGTSSMSGDQIDEFLESRAAFVETGIGGDTGFASMNCLKQDFDDVFKVFLDVLRNPAFSQDKLDLAKVQSNAAIARRNDSVGGITSREIGRLVYGPTSPLVSLEEYGTIGAITREDLVAWHRKYYHPNNMMLGVSGDFSEAAMRKTIEGAFGPWPKGPAFGEGPVTYRENANPGIYFIEKPDVTQVNIAMAHLGIEQKNPDYFAVQVMNEVLGGGFSGRLVNSIRTKKGLAYSVSGGLGAAFNRPGLMRLGMQTKSASIFEAIAALKEEVAGIVSNPPSDEEMKHAKDSILNSFIFNYDSRAGILAQQMSYAYYGLPANYLETYRSNIEKVTKDDVVRVAKKYVHPDDLTLLVVGRASDFPKPLDSMGSVTPVDITIPKRPGA